MFDILRNGTLTARDEMIMGATSEGLPYVDLSHRMQDNLFDTGYNSLDILPMMKMLMEFNINIMKLLSQLRGEENSSMMMGGI